MSEGVERTLVLIKPDGVMRGLMGRIITRFEEKGLKIVAMKMMKVTNELAEKHYEQHKGKPFFEGLINYITSAPIVAMVVEGKNAIACVRKMVGATNPQEAEPGTIRHDYAMDIGRNLIHASDSPETAKREIELFFNESEILNYERCDVDWVYE